MTELPEVQAWRNLLDDARNTQTGKLHISPRQVLTAADAAIAALERDRDLMKGEIAALKVALLQRDEEIAALKMCGRQCPACVDFTTIFTMPKVEYAGCLRKQSECNKLMDRHAAPLGLPCPFGGWTSRHPDTEVSDG